MIGAALKVVRNLTQHLRPSVLELGIAPAMHWLIDQFSANSQIECELSITGDADSIAEPYVTTLFRVAQESLTNIGRHAKASKVGVTLMINGGEVCLTISDDGLGFDAEEEISAVKGIGLSGMKERIESLGGKFAIFSATDQGSSIRCLLPLTMREED
jgi:signal transduction histidine kinase